MSDGMTVLADALALAKSGFQVIKELSDFAKRGDAEVDKELVENLHGSVAGAQKANARLVEILDSRAVPFILRVGTSFQLPADADEMDDAIKAKDVWDWTYVFNYNEDRLSGKAINDLKRSFCDPDRDGYFRKDLDTTYLAFSRESLHEEFGESIYISGLVIVANKYKKFHALRREDILPVVVINHANGETRSFSDPIVMNYMLEELLNFLFQSNRSIFTELFFRDLPSENELIIPPKLHTVLFPT